jgi:four helix bundle protein
MEKPHKKLDLWQAAVNLVVNIYEEIQCFPKEARYSLTDQIRRASLSIPSNIAEGAGRQNTKRVCELPAYGTGLPQ